MRPAVARSVAPHPPVVPAGPARRTRIADPSPSSEQEKFDAAVERNSNAALIVLAAVAIVAAVGMSTIALVRSSRTQPAAAMAMPMTTAPAAATAMAGPMTTAPTAPTAPAAAAAPAAPIRLSVAGSNKLGPDGKMHDSFSKTDFVVKVGRPTRLRIDNADSSPHSITSTATGVSITVRPGVHTYTMVATRAGRFEWVCVLPCDSAAGGWAMTHPGYMAGYITAS
jgi:hypothetical protein